MEMEKYIWSNWSIKCITAGEKKRKYPYEYCVRISIEQRKKESLLTMSPQLFMNF